MDFQKLFQQNKSLKLQISPKNVSKLPLND